MSYELVVFDWDGTLMDSTHVIAASLQDACRDVGVAVPDERDAQVRDRPQSRRHVQPRGARASTKQGRRRLAERYRHHFLARENEMPLYEGVREMLGDLRARGHRLAVATGKARRGLDRVLDSTGLRACFEATRCADEGFAKPHPGMLLMLLDITGVEARNAVMVGDTTHDLELAANAGVDAVSVSYGAHDEELLATRPAKARFASVTDLHRWLATKN